MIYVQICMISLFRESRHRSSTYIEVTCRMGILGRVIIHVEVAFTSEPGISVLYCVVFYHVLFLKIFWV